MLWDRCTFAQISNVGLSGLSFLLSSLKNPSRARAAIISNRVAFCFVTPETSCSHHRRNCRKDLSPLAVRIARWQECREQCSCRCCGLGQRWGGALRRRRCGFPRRLQRRRPLRKDGVVVDGRRVNASREELRTVMAGAPLRLRGATAAGDWEPGGARSIASRLFPFDVFRRNGEKRLRMPTAAPRISERSPAERHDPGTGHRSATQRGISTLHRLPDHIYQAAAAAWRQAAGKRSSNCASGKARCRPARDRPARAGAWSSFKTIIVTTANVCSRGGISSALKK
jgi:hypothetical protein